MSDLTNQDKINIMRLAVDADWATDPKGQDTPITLYHAMIKAITGLEHKETVSGSSPIVVSKETTR